MNIDKISEALGIEPWRIRGALDRRTIQLVKSFTPRYLVFKKDLGLIERGTSIFLTKNPEVIRGFPKIKRAFYLKSVIEKHFRDRVAVEEKMNGYNVRVFSLKDKIYSITRGGFICPYTTAKLRKIPEIRNFFLEHDVVLCGEAVGMENPYVVHAYEEATEFGFFVFDIRDKGTNHPMPIIERNALLKTYGITAVNLLGIFNKDEVTDEVFRIIRELEKENREGVVLKDPEMIIPPIKYTSSKTNTSDLGYAFRFPYDYGRDFFFSRIMREGYQAIEFEEADEKLKARAKKLGESILYPTIDTIRRVRRKEIVTEDFKIRVEKKGEIYEIIDYLKKQGVDCMVGDIKKEGRELIAEIKRWRHSSNDKIKAMLRGKIE